MSITFIERENDNFCSWTCLYKTKEDMYNDLKWDAEAYTIDFWKDDLNWKLRDYAFEYGVDSLLKDATWIMYWEKSLEDLCKNILCHITPNNEIIDYDDKELNEVWDKLGETIAKETFEDIIEEERIKNK